MNRWSNCLEADHTSVMTPTGPYPGAPRGPGPPLPMLYAVEELRVGLRGVKTKMEFKMVNSIKKAFKCEICNSLYTTKANLERHSLSVHEGKKPFKCEICGKCFTQMITFKKHNASIHKGEKLFKCDICDKKFYQKVHMKEHVLSVHEGNKPFKCDLCDYKFSRNS